MGAGEIFELFGACEQLISSLACVLRVAT